MDNCGAETFGGICAEKATGNHAPDDGQTGAWHKPSRHPHVSQKDRHSGDSAGHAPEFAGLTDEVI